MIFVVLRSQEKQVLTGLPEFLCNAEDFEASFETREVTMETARAHGLAGNEFDSVSADFRVSLSSNPKH